MMVAECKELDKESKTLPPRERNTGHTKEDRQDPCEGAELNRELEEEASKIKDRELEHLLVLETECSVYYRDQWTHTEIEVQEQETETLSLSRMLKESQQLKLDQEKAHQALAEQLTAFGKELGKRLRPEKGSLPL